MPFGGSGQDPIPANGTENLRDWSPVALMTKAVNMHRVCAVSSCHALIPWLSPIRLALGHSHRSVFCQPHVNASTSLCSLRSRPITALPRYYGRSDSCPPSSSALASVNTSSCYGQVSLIRALDLPIPPPPTTALSLDIAFTRYPSARRVSRSRGSRFHLTPAGSPTQTGRIEFVILRMDRSPPAAPHPASRRRSCIWFQAGERLPGEDFHLSDHVRFQAHWRRVIRPVAINAIARPHMNRAGFATVS
jgi:hypothetical protein